MMIASKETAVLTFATCGIALGLTAFWNRRIEGEPPALRRLWNGKHVALALGVTLLTASLFVSGFFSNLSGPLDYLRAYTPWFQRAHGTDLHRHPWNYYLSILIWTHREKGPVWSEGVIVGLALIGLVLALLPRAKSRLEGSATLARFVGFYTVTLTCIYSVIPYKTPWCVLSFLLGMILLAGIAADTLICRAPGKPLKALVILLLLAGCTQLGVLAYDTSFPYNTRWGNPYVYSPTVPDAENLRLLLEQIAAASPQRDRMVVQVFSVDNYYWPLPWYLRRFPNVGYWTEVPQDADAPIILASQEFDDTLTKRLGDTHLMHGIYGIRPNVFFELWVRMDVWKAYVETRKAAHPDE